MVRDQCSIWNHSFAVSFTFRVKLTAGEFILCSNFVLFCRFSFPSPFLILGDCTLYEGKSGGGADPSVFLSGIGLPSCPIEVTCPQLPLLILWRRACLTAQVATEEQHAFPKSCRHFISLFSGSPSLPRCQVEKPQGVWVEVDVWRVWHWWFTCERK